MKLWDEHESWESAELAWESKAKAAAEAKPLRRLNVLPDIPGITEETKRNLKWKSFKYMLFHPDGKKILKHCLRHPFRYGWGYLKSLTKGVSYKREGDFFFYGIGSIDEFVKKSAESILVVGFSYCQKPHECPSGRFTDACLHDPQNPVCQQCDIGKVWHALPESATVLLIPTIHYIGDQLFKIIHANPGKQVLFLITACEMTLEMFGDWGNMVGSSGIGVRLDGRICNTMKAFELSERGIKPGLTVVTESTQAEILKIVRQIRSHSCASV